MINIHSPIFQLPCNQGGMAGTPFAQLFPNYVVSCGFKSDHHVLTRTKLPRAYTTVVFCFLFFFPPFTLYSCCGGEQQSFPLQTPFNKFTDRKGCFIFHYNEKPILIPKKAGVDILPEILQDFSACSAWRPGLWCE